MDLPEVPVPQKIGWKGFVNGEDSGVYKATPLSRCNAADAMATPLAQAEYQRMYETLGGKPINHTLATHWARLVELLYATERWVELATDPQITGKEYRVLPTQTPTDGVGCVEAPRGTLTHHYTTDERGILTKVNLIVGTTNNNAPICMSVKKAAQGLIQKGKVSEGLLNMVEMAFRAYDPCFGCATHSLPGQMPLEVILRDQDGGVIERLAIVSQGFTHGHCYCRRGASETRIVIPNVAWEIFESLAASDCAGTRFAYDKGMLEIMSPSIEHEWFHRLLGRMIEAMTEELNIPILAQAQPR